MRQELHFVTFRDTGAFVKRAFPFAVTGQPKRVWTLFRECDEASKPVLPIVPIHRANAFLEDYVHDWNIHNGMFQYGSRVTDEPVWVLLEYDDANHK